MTPEHLLAYMVDHRHCLAKSKNSGENEANDETLETTYNEEHAINTPDWPPVCDKDLETARYFIFDQYKELTPALAAYECKDTTIFPRAAFT